MSSVFAQQVILVKAISYYTTKSLNTFLSAAVETVSQYYANQFHNLFQTQSSSPLEMFIYIASKFPEAQKRAQAEIDRVIGNDRLPTFSDRQSLPYVEAFFREVLRWVPVLPIGLAHSAIDEDIYEGFYIPKGMALNKYYLNRSRLRSILLGAIIIANVW